MAQKTNQESNRSKSIWHPAQLQLRPPDRTLTTYTDPVADEDPQNADCNNQVLVNHNPFTALVPQLGSP